MTDRKAVLEAIAYGADPKVTPTDRLRAVEALDASGDTKTENRRPTEAERQQLLLDFAMPAALAVAKGPHAIEPPVDVDDLQHENALLMELVAALEDRIVAYQQVVSAFTFPRVLAAATAQRQLPAGES